MANRFSSLPIRIAADGTVTYDFTGHIHATGLDLDEPASAPGVERNSVSWLDPGGVAKEWLSGVKVGADAHLLYLVADGAVAQTSFLAQGSDAAAADAAALAFAGSKSATIIQGDGRSSFPKQYAAGAPVAKDLRFGLGLVGVPFPGGSPQSSVVVVDAGLGNVVPSGILVSPAEGTALFSISASNFRTLAGSSTFDLRAARVDGVAPVAGTPLAASWLAWYLA